MDYSSLKGMLGNQSVFGDVILRGDLLT